MNGMDNKNKEMKEFKDLEFIDKYDTNGKMSTLEFDNGYGISVITGYGTYADTENPYEIAVLKDGSLCYDTEITDDVIGYLTPNDVTEYMIKIQDL